MAEAHVAPWCIATTECAHGVKIYVVSVEYIDKLDEALSDDRAVQVAMVNPKLASHPLVEEAIGNLAEALGVAVNQMAAALSALKATSYKSLDKAVDKSHPQ